MAIKKSKIKLVSCVLMPLWLAFGFAGMHQGAYIGITNSGTGINYLLAYNFSSQYQMDMSIGLHFERKEIDYVISGYGISENTKKMVTYLPVSIGFSKILFDDKLAGSFRPLIFGECGLITGLGRTKDLTTRHYHLAGQWAFGPGVQFAHGKSISRIAVAYLSNDRLDGSVIIKLSLFWK